MRNKGYQQELIKDIHRGWVHFLVTAQNAIGHGNFANTWQGRRRKMEDNFEDLWCDEMADFIMENLISEMMSESGEKPVLIDDDGDPFFLKPSQPFH